MKLSLAEMRLAVHQVLDCDATDLIGTEMVAAPDAGTLQHVHLFSVAGRKDATGCYVWGVQVSPSKIHVVVVLQSEQINTADEAVASYS